MSISYNYRLLPSSAELNHSKIQEKTATILVVEDDTHLMEGIREILELDSYEVMTACSGLEGLQVLESLHTVPDLIVSDIMMPKMDGYQFFEAVRKEAAWVTIPFIFLTAKGEKADIRFGKALGADDYVTKPFSAEDLLVAASSKLARKKQLQSALLAQINEMKQRILTILSHEFRTPLTYVIAYADMLNQGGDELPMPELHTYLKGVNSGAERLRRLIENFILLVELETGEIEMMYRWRQRKLDDFQRLIELAVKQEQAFIAEHKQNIEMDIAADMLPFMGDEVYLSNALACLLNNACKFSEKNSTIQVIFAPDEDGNPSIVVRDFGRGIPTGEINRIFDTFYQINRKHFEDQGAGSGLAIVRGIAQIHGAEIRVQSTEDEGSTFSLHFSRVQDEE